MDTAKATAHFKHRPEYCPIAKWACCDFERTEVGNSLPEKLLLCGVRERRVNISGHQQLPSFSATTRSPHYQTDAIQLTAEDAISTHRKFLKICFQIFLKFGCLWLKNKPGHVPKWMAVPTPSLPAHTASATSVGEWAQKRYYTQIYITNVYVPRLREFLA